MVLTRDSLLLAVAENHQTIDTWHGSNLFWGWEAPFCNFYLQVLETFSFRNQHSNLLVLQCCACVGRSINIILLARLHDSKEFQMFLSEFSIAFRLFHLAWGSLLGCPSLLLLLLGRSRLSLRLLLRLLLSLILLLCCTSFHFLNLLGDEPDTLFNSLGMLRSRSKRGSCVHHELLLACKVNFDVGNITFRCGDSCFNVSLDSFFLKLEWFFAELEESKLVLLVVPLMQRAHEGEIFNFGLDAFHADHIVRLMILLLKLYRVILSDPPTRLNLRGKSICFVLTLAWRWSLLNLSRLSLCDLLLFSLWIE